MAMQLEAVVPFGRSLDEYCQMFALTPEALTGNILGVADGPASFNAELTAQGGQVTSVDPLYAFTPDDIQQRFDAVIDNIIEQVRQTPDDWVWSYHRSPDDLRANRLRVLAAFLADYSRGDSRYVVGELPTLAFASGQFDLALCSHFLFLYTDHFTYEFHLAAMLEMLRVAREVRVFPLLTLGLARSPYLPTIQTVLTAQGYTVRMMQVPYELQRGGNEMLVVTRNSPED
ncbi:SAM-dependent methyltransferase [Nodosilinea sp. LEGE 07088]|uniref:class I SAM-dependent methyltransferase n=1 Tax=Nodosilinea sp. LEGE 07088 TaxID=2777968 RepID=UPI00187F1BBB|nr:class I SAM-dependent methyltransferase [Nodosilinea sp. LEGE 07088]MBE9135791.1 SAM-dependent methyltransferase [Nodosilinea sp. LEGE 07088]